MLTGRAVSILRRSLGDSKLKYLSLNQKDLAVQLASHHSGVKRYSSHHSNTYFPQIRRNLCDNNLKMASFKHTNRLINEKSPYLLQHAHNPVDWFPWCQEAFDKARAENKLIFLSVGYSTCHWCHVMEKESFENEEVAKIMNDHYINIKVDREERPDIDRVYMLFVMSTSGRGGWPMSVFLTPELHPITGGTYFPVEDSYGRPGFKTFLNTLKTKWEQDSNQFLTAGVNIIEALQKISLVGAQQLDSVPGKETWEKCAKKLKDRFEPEFGGFSLPPKFPQVANLNFLFHYYARNKKGILEKECLQMCLQTLTKIAKGGIHDHISHGFSRYSVDNEWQVPHFEKMLYDQAQLTVAFTDAYIATKDEFYSDVARNIIKYVNKDLRHESGGYYSAEDADSYPTFGAAHKKEGAFYVWDYEELKQLLDSKKIDQLSYFDVFSTYFNVEEDGNISPDTDPHGELTNKNVLIIYESKEVTAKKLNLSIKDFDKVISHCKEILREAREKRPRPHLDTKILCSWNGLMIAGLAKAGGSLGEQQYVDDAIITAQFIKTHLYDKNNKALYHSCYKGEDGMIAHNKKKINGFLDDYAFLIRGLLELYEASLDASWLVWAQELQSTQNALFWDQEKGGYFTSPGNDASVILKLKEDHDGAEPSGNSVSCHNLLRFASYADKDDLKSGNQSFKEMAKQLLVSFSSILTEQPIAMPELMSALILYTDSPVQVIIAGGQSDSRTLALVNAVRSRLLPGRVLALADPAAAIPSDAGVSNSLLNRIRCVNNQPAAYVCSQYACSLPVTEVKELERLLDNCEEK